MAKIKVNDKGIARVSLYLNSKNPKDKKIIAINPNLKEPLEIVLKEDFNINFD